MPGVGQGQPRFSARIADTRLSNTLATTRTMSPYMSVRLAGLTGRYDHKKTCMVRFHIVLCPMLLKGSKYGQIHTNRVYCHCGDTGTRTLAWRMLAWIGKSKT